MYDLSPPQGEIGKEMYIVNQGIVQVVGVAHGKEQILADLGPGNVFGEIRSAITVCSFEHI